MSSATNTSEESTAGRETHFIQSRADLGELIDRYDGGAWKSIHLPVSIAAARSLIRLMRVCHSFCS